jgi:hypothetical protein
MERRSSSSANLRNTRAGAYCDRSVDSAEAELGRSSIRSLLVGGFDLEE